MVWLRIYVSHEPDFVKDRRFSRSLCRNINCFERWDIVFRKYDLK